MSIFAIFLSRTSNIWGRAVADKLGPKHSVEVRLPRWGAAGPTRGALDKNTNTMEIQTQIRKHKTQAHCKNTLFQIVVGAKNPRNQLLRLLWLGDQRHCMGTKKQGD